MSVSCIHSPGTAVLMRGLLIQVYTSAESLMFLDNRFTWTSHENVRQTSTTNADPMNILIVAAACVLQPTPHPTEARSIVLTGPTTQVAEWRCVCAGVPAFSRTLAWLYSTHVM